MVFSPFTRPSPPQRWHGLGMTVPSPAHVGQGETARNCPKSDCAWWRTSPLPPHVAHLTGSVPGLAPVPLHSGHGSRLLIRTVLVVPLATSASVSFSPTLMSCPRRGSRPPPLRTPPPNRFSNALAPPPAPPRPKSRMNTISASERSKCIELNPPPGAPPRGP